MHPENIPEGMDRSRGKENCDEIRYAFFLWLYHSIWLFCF